MYHLTSLPDKHPHLLMIPHHQKETIPAQIKKKIPTRTTSIKTIIPTRRILTKTISLTKRTLKETHNSPQTVPILTCTSRQVHPEIKWIHNKRQIHNLQCQHLQMGNKKISAMSPHKTTQGTHLASSSMATHWTWNVFDKWQALTFHHHSLLKKGSGLITYQVVHLPNKS